MKPQPCKIKLYIYYQIFIIFIYKINKSFFSNNIFKHMLDIIQSVYINSSFIWCKCLYILKQCTIILKLSLKDMCPPNTLFIWSLTRINFDTFCNRDLTSFLIHYQWGHFISHFLFFSFFSLFGIFLFLFLFHTTISLFFLTTMQVNAIMQYCGLAFFMCIPTRWQDSFFIILWKNNFLKIWSHHLFLLIKKKQNKE